jgi:ppGpp synthetase/RelA/SpoT-type nucleotidyltranferase
MLVGHIKGMFLRITNPRRYFYLKNLRGDYGILSKTKHQLVSEIKDHLHKSQIDNFTLISRIKTIGSMDRKDRYIKALNRKGDHSDVIGIKIITKDKTDYYKIMNIMIAEYSLQK